MIGLVIWALIWPANANSALGSLNWRLLEDFNQFYIVIVGLFFFFLMVVAILPQTGSRVMGRPGKGTEFSNFSWFSMMFGAGLGVGLMVFATAEPLSLWGSNPVVISGAVAPNSEEALQSAYRWTFAHYGFHAWSIYVVTGLSLAYYAYTRDMPLTIRSALTPLFGRMLNGILGHIVDVLGVVATILGVSVTIGFGVSQFIDGLYAITGMDDEHDRGCTCTGHCWPNCGFDHHNGTIHHFSRIGCWTRGEIPIQPKPCVVTCSFVHICGVWLVPVCNDNICNGIR